MIKEEVKFLVLSQNDVDLDKRTIYLFHEINSNTAANIVKYLRHLDDTEGEITIYINSPGGSVPDGLSIMDTIEKCKNTIVGYVPGSAASMAVDILMSCDERVMSKHASIMVHVGSADLSGNIVDIQSQANSFNKDLEISMDLWLKKLKIKKPKLKELLRTDTFIYSRDCLKYGFIDRID